MARLVIVFLAATVCTALKNHPKKDIPLDKSDGRVHTQTPPLHMSASKPSKDTHVTTKQLRAAKEAAKKENADIAKARAADDRTIVALKAAMDQERKEKAELQETEKKLDEEKKLVDENKKTVDAEKVEIKKERSELDHHIAVKNELVGAFEVQKKATQNEEAKKLADADKLVQEAKVEVKRFQEQAAEAAASAQVKIKAAEKEVVEERTQRFKTEAKKASVEKELKQMQKQVAQQTGSKGGSLWSELTR